MTSIPEEKEKCVYATVHRRVTDPYSCAWHKNVENSVDEDFGGFRTLWNEAWIEFKILEEDADEFVEEFGDAGFKVTIEKI